MCGRRFVVSAVVVVVLFAVWASAPSALGAVVTWNGGTNTDFENAGNWTGPPTPPTDSLLADVATFNAVPANKPVLSKSRSVLGLNFLNNAGWTLGSGSSAYVLGLGANGLDTAGTAGVTVYANLGLSGPSTWTIAGSGGTTVYGVVSGVQSLTKDGAQTLSLAGFNTFGSVASTFTISAGTVSVHNKSSLGDASNNVKLNGGTLSAGKFVGFAQPITLGSSAVTLSSNGLVMTVNSAIGGAGTGVLTLTSTGDRPVVLGGNNSYDGGTSVTMNTSVWSNPQATVTHFTSDTAFGTGTITFNAGSDTMGGIGTHGTTRSLNNNLVFNTTGNVMFDGNLTLNGTVNLGSGSVSRYIGMGHGETRMAGKMSGSIVDLGLMYNGTLALTNALNDFTVSGSIKTDSFSSRKQGAVLRVTSNEALGNVSNAVTLAGSGTLQFDGTFSTARTINIGTSNDATGYISVTAGNTVTDTGLVQKGTGSAAAALRKTGLGTLVLDSANTYDNGTTVSGGMVIGVARAVGTPFGDATKAITLTNTGGLGVKGIASTLNMGIGTVTYSGGNTLSVEDTSGGANTTSLTAASLAVRSGKGTLVVTGVSGSLGNKEQIIATAGVPALVNGIIPGYIVGGRTSTGDTGATHLIGSNTVSFSPYTYTVTTIAGAAATAVVNSAGENLTAGAGIYALRLSGNITQTGSQTLTLSNSSADGSLIMNESVQIDPDVKFGSTGANEAEIYVQGTKTGTLAGKLTTTGGLTKFGDGTLVLNNAADAFSGAVNVNQGTLKVGAAGALPANLAAAVAYGATLDLNAIPYTTTSLTGSGTVKSALAATLTLNPSSNITFSGNFDGAVSLVKGGTATLTLNGKNSAMTGSITVNQGTLSATWDALGVNSPGSTVTVNSGGTLSLPTSISYDSNMTYTTMERDISLNGGTLTAGTGTHFYGTIRLVSDSRISGTLGNPAPSHYQWGLITGIGKLTYDGGGHSALIAYSQAAPLYLCASNDYLGGTNIVSGTVYACAESALGSGAVLVTTMNNGNNGRPSGGGLYTRADHSLSSALSVTIDRGGLYYMQSTEDKLVTVKAGGLFARSGTCLAIYEGANQNVQLEKGAILLDGTTEPSYNYVKNLTGAGDGVFGLYKGLNTGNANTYNVGDNGTNIYRGLAAVMTEGVSFTGTINDQAPGTPGVWLYTHAYLDGTSGAGNQAEYLTLGTASVVNSNKLTLDGDGIFTIAAGATLPNTIEHLGTNRLTLSGTNVLAAGKTLSLTGSGWLQVSAATSVQAGATVNLNANCSMYVDQILTTGTVNVNAGGGLYLNLAAPQTYVTGNYTFAVGSQIYLGADLTGALPASVVNNADILVRPNATASLGTSGITVGENTRLALAIGMYGTLYNTTTSGTGAITCDAAANYSRVSAPTGTTLTVGNPIAFTGKKLIVGDVNPYAAFPSPFTSGTTNVLPVMLNAPYSLVQGGTVVLTSGSNAIGSIEIPAGTLQVNALAGLGGATSFDVDGTLFLNYASPSFTGRTFTGSGKVQIASGTLTLNGGTVSPGSSAGKLTVQGNLAFGLDAGDLLDLKMDIVGGNEVPGIDNDWLAVTGTVANLQNIDLYLNFLTALVQADLFGDELTLMTTATNVSILTPAQRIQLANIHFLADGMPTVLYSGTVDYRWDGTTGSVVLTDITAPGEAVIPEPSALLILLMGLPLMRRRGSRLRRAVRGL